MSNDVKWTDWRSSDVVADRHAASNTANARTAWLQLLGCVLGLVLLAFGLPSPRSLLSFLTEGVADPGRSALPGANAQAAILATAGLVVWVLLIWSVAVCAAAVAGRLPGAPGLVGRYVLRRIAPAAAGRLVAAAVGVSLLAGASACAAPAIASMDPGSSAEAVSQSSPTSVAAGDGSGVADPASAAGSTIASASPAQASGTPQPVPVVPSTDGVLASIVIDWPDAAAPVVTTTSPDAAESSEQTPTSPPAAGAPQVGTDDPVPSTAVGTTESPAPATDAPAQPPANGTPPAPTAIPLVAPVSPTPTNPTGTMTPDADHPESVIVKSGDSLWSIAAHHLPPDPSDPEIDGAWRAWYFANQQVIGDNPDLIQPGQLLLPPNQK